MRHRHSSKRRDTVSSHGADRYSVDQIVKPLARHFWKDDSPQGTPRVVVDLSSQVARVYFDQRLVGQSPVSTGRAGFETPTGSFKIINKRERHFSNLYGSWVDKSGRFAGEARAGQTARSGLSYRPSPMPYFIRLTNDGVGFHQGFVPGVPASHGCIRLPKSTASTFFKHLPVGTHVVIEP